MQACAELSSAAKRFTERMTRHFEDANNVNVTLGKQVKEQAELLHARNGRKLGREWRRKDISCSAPKQY